MNAPSGKMFVSVGEKCACVKITGRATFASSIDLKTLFSELLQRGCTYFALDLTECVLMDSTFLGVLASFGLRMNGPQPDQVERTLELYNPNERIAEVLENLGVLHLFKITQGKVMLPEKTEPHDHPQASPTREEVTRTCLDAHQTLMQVHPDNVSRFKEVAQFLAEDLKKLKTPSQPEPIK
jgi:anti-sigma B factor antagonist